MSNPRFATVFQSCARPGADSPQFLLAAYFSGTERHRSRQAKGAALGPSPTKETS
jgi:hypothetical protein